MRITTNMTIRNYQTNLNRSLSSLDTTRTRVMTKRNFNKTSEDPAAASRAFKLRRDFAKTDDYLDTLKTLQGELAAVEGGLMQIKTACDDAYDLIQQAAGGTLSAEQRQIVATSLRELQKTIVLSANAKYGDKFLLGGSNTKEVPFILSDDGKTLTYRGLDINDPANADALKALSGEKLYADLGFGLEEKLSKVEGGIINVKYNGASIPIKLATSVMDNTQNPAKSIPLKYENFADTIDSLNKIITYDSSLGELQGKIRFSDDGGKLKIDYTSTNPADQKDFEIKSLSNTVLQDALGLFAGDKMSINSDQIIGASPAVNAADIAGQTLSVTYNGTNVNLTLPAGGNYKNVDDVVTQLNLALKNDTTIAGNVQFKNNNGSLSFTYKDDGLAPADQKAFSINGPASPLLTALGLTTANRIDSTNTTSTGSTPPLPDNLDGKKLALNYGGKEINLTFPASGTLNDISAVAAALNTQVGVNADLNGNVTFGVENGKLTMQYPAGSTKQPVSILASSDPGVLSTIGFTSGSVMSDQSSLTGTTPTAEVTDERFEIVDSSAYNCATIGINILGYGSGADGISNNLVILLGQMADKLTDPGYTQESMDPYQKKLNLLRDNTIYNTSELGTKSMFLDDTQKRLEDNSYTLNEQITQVENIDMSLAITEYMWAQYAYNAALKVGNSILSSSFIDFMG